MKAIGQVIELLDNDTAKIQIIRHSACSKCHACSFGNERLIFIDAINSIKAQKGEIVEIELPGSSFMIATVVVYLIPLMGFVTGIFLGKITARLYNFKFEDLFSVLIGILLMMVVYFIANSLNTRINSRKISAPNIIGITDNYN